MRKLGLHSQIRKREGVELLSREDRMIHRLYVDTTDDYEDIAIGGNNTEKIRSVFGKKKQRLNVKGYLPKRKKESTPKKVLTPEEKKQLRLKPPGRRRIDFITKGTP